MSALAPILVTDLFHELYGHLVELLERLSPEDWHRPTICSQWTVKDIVSHLLDGEMRRLSIQRDYYAPPDAPQRFASHSDLLAHLHQLNADWTRATRRISPRLLIELLNVTEPQLCDLFDNLDPFAPATFPVSWAGEDESFMWFDIAREYTERWHHQRQIADAVNLATPLDSRHLYHPVLRTFLRALPFTYRDVVAPPGTAVSVHVVGEAGGTWSVCRHASAWSLAESAAPQPASVVTIGQDDAWKLFTKRVDREEALRRFPGIRMEGDTELGLPVLEMVSIMA